MKLFNDGLILKQHQMTFLVSGDIRNTSEAFLYSLCVWFSIVKEVCYNYNAANILSRLFFKIFCQFEIKTAAGACSQEKLKFDYYKEDIFDLSKRG